MMIVVFRTIKKLWLLYLFITFFGIFVLFYGTKILFDQSSYIMEHKIKFRQEKIRSKNNFTLIVGHYIGTGNLFGNLSIDSLNANNFSPVMGEGEHGKPVVIPAKDLLVQQQLFQINRFNLLASDKISLNRSIPDVRNKKCMIKKYTTMLPTTSVIIVFHNEAWSVLLRTVWSVINRSPRYALKEILLIDDASDRDFLKSQLIEYVKQFPVPTKVFRLEKREGLVSARLLGAKHATGDTITFLDAHCECSPGWLEPLLERVKQDKRKVVCPVIDIISDDNFSYLKSFEFHWGAFNWQLNFRWYSLSTANMKKRRVDVSEPFRTPTMAGGLFTIDRDYFYEIGSYDSDMKIWGGDNLEMSFRIWQCGGQVEIAPCSHVGHLFRKSSPYTFPGGINEILNTNLARVALVWMDDWGEFYLKFNKIGNNIKTSLNVSKRLKLRENLNCKSFSWYLKNVWPEHFFPTDDRFFGKLKIVDIKSNYFKKYVQTLKEFSNKNDDSWTGLINFLQIKRNIFQNEIKHDNKEFSFCLSKPTIRGMPHGPPTLELCSNDTLNMKELFVGTNMGIIMTDEGVCLDSPEVLLKVGSMTKAAMLTCSNIDRQKWKYDVKTQQIYHMMSDYCLEGSPNLRHYFQKRLPVDYKDTFDVFIRPCTDSPLQKWIMFPVSWK